MSVFRFVFVSMAALALCLPAISWAQAPQGRQLSINVQMPRELQEAEKAYQDATLGLTPDQLSMLKALEGAYMQTIDLDMQIVSADLETGYCAGKPTAIAKERGKYQSYLGLYRNQKQAELLDLRGGHRKVREAKAPFIDQKLLDGHYAHMTTLMVSIGAQMMAAAFEAGASAKTDCNDLKKKLDAAYANVGKKPANAGDPVASKLDALKAEAEKGDPDAMVTLGMLYTIGQGVPKDTEKGQALLTRAAEGGYERAQYMLGLFLGTAASGLKPDKEKSKYWLKKAAAQGNKKAAAMLEVAENGPPPESFETIKSKAEAGDVGALYELGARYSHGLGVEKNAELGRKWLLLAAGKGHPLAQSDAGLMLLNEGKVKEGLVWMTRAAEQGVVNSQFELGQIYGEGRIVKLDREKAKLWLQKASENGDSRATAALKKLSGQ